MRQLSKNGAITLKQEASADALWASQNQIADIFEVKRPAITKHIRNILKDKELNSTFQNGTYCRRWKNLCSTVLQLGCYFSCRL